MAKDRRNEYRLRLVDKYLESVNIYWSALITINGLLLTFFSIDALSSNEKTAFFNYFLIGACITSLWLLIWNFRTIKLNYYKIGKLTVDDLPDVPEGFLGIFRDVLHYLNDLILFTVFALVVYFD